MTALLQVFTLLVWAACIPVGVYTFLNLRANARFIELTRAQLNRGTAYRDLEAAYRSKTDPTPARAAVADAEEAVRKAETRLPRGRWTREYLARRESS